MRFILILLAPLLLLSAASAQDGRKPIEPGTSEELTVKILIASLSFEERLKVRWEHKDRPGFDACDGLQSDFVESERSGYSYKNSAARKLMVMCGYDLSEFVKGDLRSGNPKKGSIGILTWRQNFDDKYLKAANISQFVIDTLVSAEPIANWQSPDARFPYYMAVTAIMEYGKLDELRGAIAKRSDAKEFDAFLVWRDKYERMLRPLY